MLTRRSSLVFLALGGLLVTTAAAGVTQVVSGTPLAATQVVETEAREVSRFRSEAPSLEELQPSADDPGAAPKLEELQQPTNNMPLTAQARSYLRRTIGTLHAEFPGNGVKRGTATVVDSGSGDLLITAGHLLVDELGQSAVVVRFVPGQSVVALPTDYWYAREWATVPGSDVGMVLLYPRAGKHIRDEVEGSQGVCFECEQRPFVHVYGYPDDLLGGRGLDLHCQVNADFTAGPDYPYGHCIEGEPAMTNGSGGSAVLADLDPGTGRGAVTAVHTSVFPDAAGRAAAQGAAFLGRAARDLYQRLHDKSAAPVRLRVLVTNLGAFNASTAVTLPGGEPVCRMPDLSFARTEAMSCDIPGGGSFVVGGQAVAGAGVEHTYRAVPSPSVLCFTYSGTVFRNSFGFAPKECE